MTKVPQLMVNPLLALATLTLLLPLSGCADGPTSAGKPGGPGPGDPPSQEPPPGEQPQHVWGALGDSQTDEYQADDGRGDANVLNWLELLVLTRDLDFGDWSSSGRGEPRRRGFEYNWARSGAVMSDVVGSQLDGLARQMASGEATHAVLFSTGNEWVNRSPYLMMAIYESPDGGVTDATGVRVQQRVDQIAGRIIQVMERLAEAVERAGTGGGVVIMTPTDFVLHPGVAAMLPDVARRGYVSDAVESIYQSALSRAEEINEEAGRTVISVTHTDEHLRDVWATADGQYVTAAGVRLDYTRETTNGNPYYLALAPTAGSAHMGTIGNGIFARAFIDAANRLDAVAIPQLSDADVRAAAGIDDD